MKRIVAFLFVLLSTFVLRMTTIAGDVFSIDGRAIPIYPGAVKDDVMPKDATIGDFMGLCMGITSFRTRDEFAKVREFYQSAMPPGTEKALKAPAQGFIVEYELSTDQPGKTVNVLVIGEPPGFPAAAPHFRGIEIAQRPPEPNPDATSSPSPT